MKMQDYLVEQFELYKERIAEIPQETMPEGRFADFFVSAAEYINYVIRVREELGGDGSYKGSEDLSFLRDFMVRNMKGPTPIRIMLTLYSVPTVSRFSFWRLNCICFRS